MIRIEQLKNYSFGEWGKIERMAVNAFEDSDRLCIEVTGYYKGNLLKGSLHTWTIEMLNEGVAPEEIGGTLRTLCGRVMESKLRKFVSMSPPRP